MVEEKDNKRIIDIVKDYFGDNLSQYSGRGMYGQTCVALRVDDLRQYLRVCLDIIIDQARFDSFSSDEVEFTDELKSTLSSFRTGSLGRSMVVYFPNLEWIGSEEQSNDEGDA